MKWLCLSMKSCPDMWLVTLMKITKVSVLSGYEPCASRIRDRSVGTGSQYSTVPTLHCIGTGSQYSTVHTVHCIGTGSQYSTVLTLHCIGTGSQYSTVPTLHCIGTGSQYSTVPTLHCIGTGSQYSTVHTLYCTAPHCTRPSRVLLCTAHLYRSHSGRCSALCDRPTCLTAYCKLRVSVDTVFVKRRTARRPV